MEIISESVLTQNQFSITNSNPFKNHIINKSSQIFNHETNLFIKINNIFEEINKKEENNIFYLDYLYFKHINIAKEKYEEKVLKYSNITFKPKVSVIIPIYNVQNYLPLCIESIIYQTLKEIEIICVNDGSTDDSLLIILKYSKKDNRIMIINQRNRGLSEARNTGVKYSNGEYIYYIDSDDYLEKNALFELYEYSKKNNLDVIYFQSSSFKIEKNIGKKKKENLNINFVINKKNIMKGKYLDVNLRTAKKYGPVVWLSFLKKKFCDKIGLSFYPGILHEDVLYTFTGILFLIEHHIFKKNITIIDYIVILSWAVRLVLKIFMDI